jgi:hypothetical protein
MLRNFDKLLPEYTKLYFSTHYKINFLSINSKFIKFFIFLFVRYESLKTSNSSCCSTKSFMSGPPKPAQFESSSYNRL